MNSVLSQQTVGQLVADRPSRSRIFERWGIDYCCGGKKRLAESCAALSIDFDAVQRELQDEAVAAVADVTNWTRAPLSELVANIVSTHHAYLREALPRLTFLTQKVRDAHAKRRPELVELAEVFTAFRAEMEEHALKEEKVLFPYIEKLDGDGALPEFACGSACKAIQALESEHESAGAALDTMRRLTNGYATPEEACGTYRAMLDALAQLEADMHVHVHKENSILFPRAITRERMPARRVADGIPALTGDADL